MPKAIKKLPPLRQKFSISEQLGRREWPQEVLIRMGALLEFSSIYIAKYYRRNRESCRVSHRFEVRICHKNKMIMDWIIKWFGGSYTNSAGYKHYIWSTCGISASIILNTLQHYCLSKKPHAAIAVLYASTIVRAGARKHKPLTQEEEEYRDLLGLEVRRLNDLAKEVDDIRQLRINQSILNNPRTLNLFDLNESFEGMTFSFKDKSFFDDFLTYLEEQS